MSMLSYLKRHTGMKVTFAGLLFSYCACALGQVPAVVSSNGAAVPHNEQYGAPWQTAVSNRGDFLLYDFKTDGLYEFPATGGPEITIAAPGVIAGGFTNSGIAIDPRNNNIYLDNNYNGGLLEYPFNPQTGQWDLPRQVVASDLSGNLGGSCGSYFQGAGLSINHSGVMAVATENGCGVEIFTVPIDASGNFGAATPIVSNMKARAKTVAIDDAGNISFNEDAGGRAGVLFIPAGTTGLADDSAVTAIFNGSGNNVQGVSVDANGSLYIADASIGEYLVPLGSGLPDQTRAVLLSSVGATGGPSIDSQRQVLFVPVPNGNAVKDIEKFYVNRAELGSSAVLTAAAPGAVTYYFSATATPAAFLLQQSGNAGDFALGDLKGCGITASGTTTYGPSGSANTCALSVTFTPHYVGDSSAQLVMTDKDGTVLNTTTLHGVGLGSAVQALPGVESAVGSKLLSPAQTAVDAAGNLFVADPGSHAVFEYPKGSTAATSASSIGTKLASPTGVAVDGAGNVYIADSGSVFAVPNTSQGLDSTKQSTIATGFGSSVRLASDGIGDIFVADLSSQRVTRIHAALTGSAQTQLVGFTQLTAIAASGSGDLYLVDGQNLYAYSATNAGGVVANNLIGVTGLAVDASGSIYVSEAAGTLRIPNEAGVLNPAHQLTVASVVKSSASVSIDSVGNVYVADSGSGDVDLIATTGYLNFGTLATTSSTASNNVSVANLGNLPLNITGFSSTPDYSVTTTDCVGNPIATGNTCSATIVFSPGPGDQGSLPGQITIQSDSANAPNAINLVGVGASLAATTSTYTQTGTPISGNVSFSVSVTPSASSAVTPTGTVTVKINGKDASGVTIPTVTVTQTLNNGSAAFNLTTLEAGSYAVSVTYNGDRVYGRSTTTSTLTVAAGTVSMVQPSAGTLPTYVLSKVNALEPTDGSTDALDYVYQLQVVATGGNPLVGVPAYDSKGNLTAVSYGSVAFQVAGGGTPCPVPTPVGADGTVLFATSCLPIDTSNNQTPNLLTTYTLTPVFTSPDYKSVTGSPFTLTALRHPVVVLSSSSPALTLSAGSTASTTLSLNSLLGYGVAGANVANNGNNYTLPVALSCDGLPAHATCSFSYPTPDPSDPNSVDVTPTAPGTVVMTVNTNVPVGTTTGALALPSKVFFAALFGFTLFGFTFKKKTFRSRLSTSVCLLLTSVAIASMGACGGGTNSSQPVLTTPTGTYKVTVSARQVGSKTVPGSSPGTTVTVYGTGNLMSLPFTVSVAVK